MQFDSLNLFPLARVNSHYEGYFIAKDGSVYSTKRPSVGKMPYKMLGSGYGSMRYYTLNKISVDGYTLMARARAHKDFDKETSPPTIAMMLASATHTVVAKRSHAKAVDEGIKGRGVVIAQVAVHDGQEHLLFGSKPAIHMTEASYRDEMTRLAASKPGTKFVALKVVASVVSGGVKWE